MSASEREEANFKAQLKAKDEEIARMREDMEELQVNTFCLLVWLL